MTIMILDILIPLAIALMIIGAARTEIKQKYDDIRVNLARACLGGVALLQVVDIAGIVLKMMKSRNEIKAAENALDIIKDYVNEVLSHIIVIIIVLFIIIFMKKIVFWIIKLLKK